MIALDDLADPAAALGDLEDVRDGINALADMVDHLDPLDLPPPWQLAGLLRALGRANALALATGLTGTKESERGFPAAC